MMRFYDNPPQEKWGVILKRPSIQARELHSVVGKVLDDVRCNGDAALKKYEWQFDKTEIENFLVTDKEIADAEKLVSPELKDAIRIAHENIYKFHAAQKFTPVKVETCKGVVCEQRAVAIEKVGLYIPGGTAPLFSTVLMLAVPAKIAGCGEILLCTPPNERGKCNPAVLYAAKISGVSRIYKIGGAQAIAAMAFGTETVPKVDKIFGPGNQYVVAAKQLVSLEDVAIDMPAGPSEVEVIADVKSNPVFVAADLLSQAEHGADSQVVLVATNKRIIETVEKEIERQLQKLPRKDIAEKALQNSKTIYVPTRERAIAISNFYAPEHLVIATDDCDDIVAGITHAGSVFLGKYSCESAGDYASGTNHTLPTKGYAKAYSGLCLDSFMRKITIQRLSPEGVKTIGKAVELMAEAEGLEAHKNAMTVRLDYVNGKRG